MKGYIYILVCETGKTYYGSTFNAEKRKQKGWYKSSCRDFINPTFSIIEEVEVESKQELWKLENEYIRANPECVNRNIAIQTAETQKEYERNYRQKNHERVLANQRKYDEKLKKIIVTCEHCGKKLKKRSLAVHQSRHCHSLPQQAVTKVGGSASLGS
jgi:hypothetical protein